MIKRLAALLAALAAASVFAFVPARPAGASDYFARQSSTATTVTTTTQEITFGFSAFEVTCWNGGSVNVHVSVDDATATTNDFPIQPGAALTLRRRVEVDGVWYGMTGIGAITASSTATLYCLATRDQE